MRCTAHPMFEAKPRFFVPGIAVPSAHTDSPRGEGIDRLDRTRQLRRERYSPKNILVFKQARPQLGIWLAHEFFFLRAPLRSREKRTFHMNTSHLWHLLPKFSRPL